MIYRDERNSLNDSLRHEAQCLAADANARDERRERFVYVQSPALDTLRDLLAALNKRETTLETDWIPQVSRLVNSWRAGGWNEPKVEELFGALIAELRAVKDRTNREWWLESAKLEGELQKAKGAA